MWYIELLHFPADFRSFTSEVRTINIPSSTNSKPIVEDDDSDNMLCDGNADHNHYGILAIYY